MSHQDEQLLESLSALLDGEGNELDLQRVLRGMEADPSLRERWQRYQLVSQSMRSGSVSVLPDGLAMADSVRAAVAGLPSTPRTWRHGWSRQLGKTAVAASVALGILVGTGYFQQQTLSGQQIAVTAPPASPVVGIGHPGSQLHTVALGNAPSAPASSSRPLGKVPAKPPAQAVSKPVSQAPAAERQ